jgi:hypothetical protein
MLVDSGADKDKYEASAVACLPPEFLETIGVEKIKKRGILHKDKEVEQQKKDRAVEKHASRCTGTPFTMDEFKAKANLEVVGNDLVWEDPAKVLRKKDLERLTRTSFWTTLTVKKGFKVVLQAVLPNFWEGFVS